MTFQAIAICGAIGAGKTTLARQLADELGFDRLSADEIRLELTGDPEARGMAVWIELVTRAQANVQAGKSLILDSTGIARTYRELVTSLGDDCFRVRLECSWRTWLLREGGRARIGEVKYPSWKASLIKSRQIPVDLVLSTDRMTSGAVLDRVLEQYGQWEKESN